MSSPPGNILIIQVSRIGDTLFATPAIRAIAEACPDAKITVLGHPGRAEVFRNVSFIHHVGAIEKRRAWLRGWLPGKPYDLAFVFGFDEPLVAYALRVAQRVVAFRQASESLNRRLYKAVEAPVFQANHAVRQLLPLSAAMGWTADNLRLAFRVGEDEFVAARQMLKAEIGDMPAFLVGLQVASFHTKAYRDWPVESFAALAKRIRDYRKDAHFLIFGGKDEHQRTTWLHGQLSGFSTHLAGRLTLRQTAACMALTQLYVGVDTGPTHIMSAFDIPMVALYHCWSPSRLTGPLQHPACVAIDHPDSDGNCSDDSSMSDITVEYVFERIRGLLDAQAKQASS
jgi:heptosyltransferase-3